MPRYAAFLRGINVGGNKKVPMAALRKALEKAGFRDTKTLLASGNVVFTTDEIDSAKVKGTFESAFTSEFGFSSYVVVRSADQIEKLMKSAPFRGIRITPDT